VRITAPTTADAKAIGEIKRRLRSLGIHVPLVADIHFSPAAAMEAAEYVVKVRVNPGNFADQKFFRVREYSDAYYAAEIERIEAEAETRGIDVTIVVDWVHVLEYLWSAAWSFFAERDPAAEDWVADKAIEVPGGRAPVVAAAIRRFPRVERGEACDGALSWAGRGQCWENAGMADRIEPFAVSVGQAALDDLRARLRRADTSACRRGGAYGPGGPCRDLDRGREGGARQGARDRPRPLPAHARIIARYPPLGSFAGRPR